MSTVTEQLQNITKIENDIAVLNGQRLAELGTLRESINVALICWTKQFPEFSVPETDGKIGIGFDRGSRDKIFSNERLCRVRLAGETLTVYFEETFRGEINDFEITLPVRYLGTEGEAAIVMDANSLKDEKRLRDAEAKERSAQAERELYSSLHAKYSAS